MIDRSNIISKVTIYKLDVPLIKPYKLSYNTFYSFEPLLIHIIDEKDVRAQLLDLRYKYPNLIKSILQHPKAY